MRVVVSGGGAAGTAIVTLLLAAGVTDVVVVDRAGALSRRRRRRCRRVAPRAGRPSPTRAGCSGDLQTVLAGADVFIGVSAPGVLKPEWIEEMADDAVVFALANPDPEVDPAEAEKYAAVVASGRSDYPNQINNVLAFPGVFRGLLDARASEITIDMLLRAAEAIALVVKDEELNPNFIIPTVFHPDVPKAVAAAISGRPTTTEPPSERAGSAPRRTDPLHRLVVEEHVEPLLVEADQAGDRHRVVERVLVAPRHVGEHLVAGGHVVVGGVALVGAGRLQLPGARSATTSSRGR